MPTPFGFWFPNHGTDTYHWLPHRGPVSGGTRVTEVSGLVANLLADKRTYHKYMEAPDPFEIWVLAFAQMSESDRATFKAFQRVILGAQFEMYDVTTDAYFLCQFAPDNLDVEWQVEFETGDRWSAAITLYVQA
jgi:hypothetical protein